MELMWVHIRYVKHIWMQLCMSWSNMHGRAYGSYLMKDPCKDQVYRYDTLTLEECLCVLNLVCRVQVTTTRILFYYYLHHPIVSYLIQTSKLCIRIRPCICILENLNLLVTLGVLSSCSSKWTYAYENYPLSWRGGVASIVA